MTVVLMALSEALVVPVKERETLVETREEAEKLSFHPLGLQLIYPTIHLHPKTGALASV